MPDASRPRSLARRARRRVARWIAADVEADLRAARRKLRATRGELRHARARLAAAEHPVPPEVERTIARAREEHLTYLKETGLRELAAIVLGVEADRLPGVIVEAGTARGGSAIVIAAAKARERPMKVYDVFGMIPPPTDRDGPDVHERYRKIAGGEARGVGGETYYGYRDDLCDEVTASFARLGVPVAEHNVELIQGLFEDTIDLDGPVAFAHLDGDWYESTMTCLTRIAPRLVPGGRIVLDDYYAWSGCRAAVDEYFRGRDGFRLERRAKLHVVREAPRGRRRARRRAPMLRSVERGRSLDEAVVDQVRTLVAGGEDDSALALAESLRGQARTATLGHVAAGVVAFRRGHVDLAREHFRSVPAPRWAALAPAEYVRSGLAVAPGETLREIRELVAADPPEMRAKAWFDVLGPVHGLGEQELAREVFAVFDRHVREDPDPWRPGVMHRDWLRPWVNADAGAPTAPPPPGRRRTFAIMDYGHPSPGKASANLGDHIQSIAALGHLVRHREIRLHGPAGLLALLTELGERTRPERRLREVTADVEVRTVHRDASMYEPIAEDTWALCFGWYMHALFNMRHGFPLHRNLRPVFVSFHCNKRELLTPAAVEYLQRYGPVGCRDWTTVYLLLSLGVPAFFSGCLTTTIDTLFGDLDAPPAAGAPLAAVDVPPPPGAVAYRHSDDAVRRRPFLVNVHRALALLETYRREHRGVVTSRLHCYLPVRSIGVEVDFRPPNRSDIRFDGLIDLPDEDFDAIRDGLNGKLERLLTALLSGRPEADVYALWREINAADVAAAEERRGRELRLPPVRPGVARRLARAAAKTAIHGEPPAGAVHCAVVLPKRGGLDLSVLAASLLEHASRPLHVWVLARPGTRGAEPRLAERFPRLTFGWIPVRRLEGAARLLLPDLLPGVDRVVVLPIPAVATGDVAALADLDLGAHALAAPETGASGFGVIHAAAARLGARTDASAELRRAAHARHRFDFDAFTGDVLVLDLERLRRERLGERALPLMDAFGLDEVEVLHHLAGPGRAAIPPEWAVVPTRTPPRGPGLVHWADGVHPRQPELTPERELWRRYAAALSGRRAASPTPSSAR